MYIRICCDICTFFYFQVSVFDGTYDIRTPQTDFTVITVQDDEDRPMRSYTLGELKPSAFYQVEVRTRNDIGYLTRSLYSVQLKVRGPIPLGIW